MKSKKGTNSLYGVKKTSLTTTPFSFLLKAEKKLGYVPEKDNVIFARLMDAGKLLLAKIKDVEKKGSFTKISIGIYLEDF